MRLTIFVKLMLLTLFALMMLPLNIIKAQSSFNGKIEFKMQDKNGKIFHITYFFQNGNMRMDLPKSAMDGKAIYDCKRQINVYDYACAENVY